MLAFSLYILKKKLCAWFLLFLSIFFFAFQFFMLHFILILLILILLSNQYLFSVCSSIQFFNSFLWLTRHYVIPLVNTLISHNLCDLQETISHYWSPLSLPIQPLPTEAENFPRVFKHPKHVLLPIYLAYLLPKSTSW